MKCLFLISVLLLICQSGHSQTVTVEATTNPKKIAEILQKNREDVKANQIYFAEANKCRQFTQAGIFKEAEISCRTVITYAENLPKDRFLERSSAYEGLACVLLWEKKIDEAIILLKKSLETRKLVSDDSDAEVGGLYFLLGQAFHLLNKVDEAEGFYNKAENTYRIAFKNINDDEIGGPYPKSLVMILEAHLVLLKKAGLNEEAAKVEKRLTETKVEFAKFLD
jgi:tetratricopeptide (TPR) repeat protein